MMFSAPSTFPVRLSVIRCRPVVLARLLKGVSALAVFGACLTSSFAQATTKPVLDLVVEGGQIKNLVPESKVEFNQVATESPKWVQLEASNAISIPNTSEDPLFSSGPKTFLLTAQFDHLGEKPQVHVIMGQWRVSDNQRGLVLSFRSEGNLQFYGSEDGTAEKIKGPATKDTVPNKRALKIVASFDPGKGISYGVYDEDGVPLEIGQLNTGIPASFFPSEAPFDIGGSPGLGMRFHSAKVWNEAFTKGQIQQLVEEMP